MKKIVTIVSVVLLVLLAVACDPEVHTHDYKEVKEEVEATCTKVGYKVLRCSCGAEKIEDIKILDHKWNKVGETVEATCTRIGTETVECNSCHVMRVEKVSDALGHDTKGLKDLLEKGYNSYSAELKAVVGDGCGYSVAVPATCVNPAKYSAKCERKNCEETVEVSGDWCDYSFAGHRYNYADGSSWTPCKDATILDPGYKAPVCGLGCANDTTGHWYEDVKTVDTTAETRKYKSVLGVWALYDTDEKKVTNGEYLVFTGEGTNDWNKLTEEEEVSGGLTRFKLNTDEELNGKVLDYYTTDLLDYTWIHDGTTEDIDGYTRSKMRWNKKTENYREMSIIQTSIVVSDETYDALTITWTDNDKKEHEETFVREDTSEGEIEGSADISERSGDLVYLDREYHYFTKTYKSATEKDKKETWTVREKHTCEESTVCNADYYGEGGSGWITVSFVAKKDNGETVKHTTYLQIKEGAAEVTTNKVLKEIQTIYLEPDDIWGDGYTRTWRYNQWSVDEKEGSNTMTFGNSDAEVTVELSKKKNL